jgi:hypothetical protein
MSESLHRRIGAASSIPHAKNTAKGEFRLGMEQFLFDLDSREEFVTCGERFLLSQHVVTVPASQRDQEFVESTERLLILQERGVSKKNIADAI